jgi:hypothetical protein
MTMPPFQPTPNTEPTLTWLQRIQIGWLRAYRTLGLAGLSGAAFLVMSMLAWIGLGKWSAADERSIAAQAPLALDSMRAVLPPLPALLSPTLRSAAEAPDVIKQLSKSIQRLGLACPHADYKVIPITDTKLGQLEVHASLKGPYPKVRALMDTLLSREPGLAIKEFSLQRANADATDVEAKLRLVVYLSDGWSPLPAKEQAAEARP